MAGAAAEAGKALLGCDPDGNVQWNNTHGGIAGALRVAVDQGTVYVQRESDPSPDKKVILYRVDAKDGIYSKWAGTEETDLPIASADVLEARGGKIFLAYTKLNQMQVLDGQSGKPLKIINVPSPTAVGAIDAGTLLIISGGKDIFSVDVASGEEQASSEGSGECPRDCQR